MTFQNISHSNWSISFWRGCLPFVRDRCNRFWKTPRASRLNGSFSTLLTAIVPSGCDIEVSYDTSTPFFCAAKLIAISSYSVSPYCLSVKYTQINKKLWAGNPSPFPYQLSEIAKRMSMSDIVHLSARGTPFLSTEGYLLQNDVRGSVPVRCFQVIPHLSLGCEC
jgi:hypothetical protein